MRLGKIAHARAGDKGNTSDITVIAYHPGDYPLLREQLTSALVRELLADIVRGFFGVLPLAVIGSFVTGILDARLRFRRSSTPILSVKKAYGLALFLFSLTAALIVFAVGPYVPWARVVDVAALSAGVVCAVRLGRIGHGLIQAIFPG